MYNILYICHATKLPTIMKKITLWITFSLSCSFFYGQHSVAREWNEQLLLAIRTDTPRPTVHARNLFHTSLAMYDAWAVFDNQAETVLLGKNYRGFNSVFNGIAQPGNVQDARNEAISYAAYRLLSHRFAISPNASLTQQNLDIKFADLGYDKNFTSMDYSSGSYAALGNYIANEVIVFGFQDLSNEQNNFENQHYQSVNPPLIMSLYQDNGHIDPNRWQPLTFGYTVDEDDNIIPNNPRAFLSPEWGQVTPFCLKSEELDIFDFNGFDNYVYNNPGGPVYIQNSNEDGIDDPYKWNFALVIAWSAHLDPNESTLIDISPAASGNVNFETFPETFEEYKSFYNFTDGNVNSPGHSVNPYTNLPYAPQMVKRGDYGRILAEFWADGPNSETPPGHWFSIFNEVSDHPLLEKRLGGQGPVLDDLEWDVKSYLTLGGAVHDVAVNIWGVKSYYDFIRPISAIRYMASKGQSSNAALPSYDAHGLPLIEGLIEVIESGDPLVGTENENLGKIKIYSWKGPDFIGDPNNDVAGVDWILGTHWWPYQLPSFVTPPFAGYLSGHSTFSRAAADVITQLTGSPYFPGGLGSYVIPQNDFLLFENGPSENIVLEWATYQDASDQASLSRIWGGIHPPIDDIRGRLIGRKIALDSYNLALDYFNGTLSADNFEITENTSIYPMPFNSSLNINSSYLGDVNISIYSIDGKIVEQIQLQKTSNILNLNTESLAAGFYVINVINASNEVLLTKKIIKS